MWKQSVSVNNGFQVKSTIRWIKEEQTKLKNVFSHIITGKHLSEQQPGWVAGGDIFFAMYYCVSCCMSAHTDCLLAVYTLYMRSWFLRWNIQSLNVSWMGFVVWMCFHVLYGSERCVRCIVLTSYLNTLKLIYKYISSHWVCSKANTVSYQHANMLTL